MAVLVVIAFAALAAALFLQRRRKRSRRSAAGNKKVLIRKGLDVQKLVAGEEKGDYFSGKLKRERTFFVDPETHTRRIRLEELATGRQTEREILYQLWIGREESACNPSEMFVVSGDPKVSRIHCRFFTGNGKLYLEDAGSRNHTYLNGEELVGKASLKSGDKIRVGDTSFRIWI